MRGAKLYDPRTGTTVWSENPALMMRHVYAHSKFGKATVTSAENARFTAAANTCDTSTVYTVASVAQPAMALFKAALVAPFGTPAKSLFDDLSQAMGGSWAFAGGELYLKPGIYTASVMSLTDADLAVVKRSGASEQQSPIGISVHKERAQKFNTVKATIWDADQDYKQVALTPLAGAALVTRDGVELVQEVSFPAIGYAPQALHVAGVMMRDARDPLVVDLPFKLRAYPLELFDTVDLTLSRYGWSAKTFMVLSRTWNMDGSIQLTLKETSASITQMDASFLAQGWAANTNLPTPWAVADVGTLTIASGTAELMRQADGTVVSRMRVTWTQVADAAVVQNGQIEVQYRKSDETGAWTSIVVPGNETQCITSEVEDGIIYIVRARAKTSVAVGDWCAQVEASIVGKTSAPSNVTGLANSNTDTSINLSWNACTDADYSDTELREGVSWAAGGLLFKGDACKWSAVGVPSATYTVWAKHFDTSGNESAAAAGLSVVFNLIRPIASIGDYASAPSTTGLLKNNVYKNTTNGNTYILSTDSGSWVLWIEKGTPGDDGVRGTVNLADAGHTSWPSDATVDAVISAAGYGAPQNRDMVTMYGAGYSETRFYLASGGTSPSAHWNTIAAYINGNMLVDGTVVADAINAGAIDGETITGATVRTAASGARTQMDSTSFKSYDASGNIIVEIGNTGATAGISVTPTTLVDYGFKMTVAGFTIGYKGVATTAYAIPAEYSCEYGSVVYSDIWFTNGTEAFHSGHGTGYLGGQLTLAVATGTKPLAITSTTKCDNLNADMLDDLHASDLPRRTIERYTSNGTYTIANGTGTVILDYASPGAITVIMPASPANGQEVTISAWYTQTALTHQANTGQNLSGALSSTMGGGTGGRWVFISATGSWFRADKAV